MNLHQLAAHAGVATSYRGADGRPVTVNEASLAAVLECLGVRTDIAPARAAAAFDRERAERGRVEVRWDVPPFGYFEQPHGWLISAPRRAHPFNDKFIGLFAPTYALRRRGRGSVGDLHGLRQLFDFGCDLGARAVLTLPLLAVLPDEPSPYSPISRLHWNELYCPLEARTAPTDLIDYPAAFAEAHTSLAAELAALGPSQRRELERFLDAEPDVRAYAQFRARNTGDRVGRPPIGAGVARLHEYGQWRMHRELASLRAHVERRGGQLGLDLPLGVHPHGYDAVRHADQFVRGACVGAPPDRFFPGGQNWGFAPLLPQAAEQAGHAYFAASVRNHLRYASYLRIDHVMQFERLYWIPDGFAAAEGTYVYNQLDQYIAVLTLESHLHKAPIVGENLGLVSAELDRALDDHGIYGSFVAYADLLGEPTGASIAAVNTHDMATFAGYCEALDLLDQAALGQLSPADAQALTAARRAALAQLAAQAGDDAHATETMYGHVARRLVGSPSPLTILSVEDLWLEPAPQNVPGTSTERPNWRRPCRYLTEQFGTFAPKLTEIIRPARQP